MPEMQDREESAVVDRYANMVYRLAYAQLQNRSDADDIFQEVFLRYIRYTRGGGTFQEEEHRKAWLLRVTVNCCKKHSTCAWRRHTVPLEEKAEGTYELPEEALLHSLLLTLPAKYRIVLHLFYFEDLPVQDIADILKKPPSTVRTQLTRARRMLRNIVEEDEEETSYV